MSAHFAPGSVHAGWRVTGPPPEGTHHRWPVEKDGRAGTLTFFPSAGARADTYRELTERHAAWRKLEHPSLLRVDTGPADGGVFVVVPALQHQGEGALAPDEALAVVERLAQALRVFHEAGVAHGEVDAWSVVKEGGDGPALLPPGLRGPPPGLEGLGLHADPRYAAPEVLDGQRATPESDVFSLGLVLYRLLTGQVPVAGGDPLEVLVARGGTPAPPLTDEQAPAHVIGLYRCLTAPRGQRPKDAAAALALVARARKGSPIEPPRRVVRQVRRATIGGPLVLLAALIGAGVAAWSLLQSRLAPPAAPFDEFRFDGR